MNYRLRKLLRTTVTYRRQAVDSGELRRMWPGAAWDLVSLVWWRGIYWPVTERLRPHGGSRAELHPDCPLCNPER